MSHVCIPNYQKIYPTEHFQTIWMLTRAMLAAGWRYKASADATGTSTNKDTSSNPVSDKWAVGGAINYAQVGAQTGTAPVIGAPTAGVSVVTGVSGFTAHSVGRFLIITGAVNTNNNGAFRIIAQGGTSVSIFNPGAVSETTPGSATWTEVQGGAGLTITTSGTGGAQNKRCIVSGLIGMLAPTTAPLNRGSVGDHLTIIGGAVGNNNGTFRITRVLSTTSVEIDNPNATSVGETNNGSIIWVESSPTAQTYPVSLQGATGLGSWVVLQGPSTMKIPIGTNVPTGSFVRGERVTQTTSGATGTILGVCTDTAGGLGFAVIVPRTEGTGAGPRGWSSGLTDTLTGGTSGATITSTTAAPIEYVREFVFWKNTQVFGHIFTQCVDQNLEAAYRFSTIAAGAGITNIMAPGSGTTFPIPGSYVVCGTANTAGSSTGSNYWGFYNFNTGEGLAHLMCANCIGTSTDEEDGSWIWAYGTPSNSAASYAGNWFMRCDDSEEGDVDPYVTLSPSGTYYDGNRTAATNTLPQGYDVFSPIANTGFFQTNITNIKGWRRRGFPTLDSFQNFQASTLNIGLNANTYGIGRVQHTNLDIFIREAFWVTSSNYNQKMRKGTMRWLFFTEGGTTNTTYANGQWVQLGTSLGGPIVAGPWDGQTTPVNA